MKRILSVLLLSVAAFAQRPIQDAQTASASGQVLTFNNDNGAVTVSFEEVISGSPASSSIAISGCMRSGTCEVLDTYTGNVNAIRKPNSSSVAYDYYTVTPTWSGGSSPTVKVNRLATIARAGGGGVGGGVTSVALTLPGEFTCTGSPITTSGTFNCSWASQTANKVLASPSGSSGAPSFRALASLDIPNNAANTTGTASALASTPTNCGAGVAAIGILANGNATGCFTPAGTGNTTSTTLTTNKLPKANGPNSIVDSSVTDNGTTVSSTESINAPSLSTGTSPAAAGASAAGGFDFTEAASTGWTPTAGEDYCRADSVAHAFKCSLNALAESQMALASNNLGFFASTTSAQLATVLSDESGTGVVCFTVNCAMTTPNLGTPSAVNLANGTGLPLAGLASPPVTGTTGQPVAMVGTNSAAGVTPLSFRSSTNANIESATGHGDSIYTILATDRFVYTNAAFTASRTWTLPAANAVNAGGPICVFDLQGTVTGTNTLVISRAGADTINGAATTFTFSAANDGGCFVSDGTSKWAINVAPVSVANGGTGTTSTLTGIMRGGNPFTAAELSQDCTTSGTNAVTCTELNGANFTVNTSGVPTKIGGITTAGQGAAIVQCITSAKVETAADASVLSCTPAAAVGGYEVCVALDVSAASAATLGWTATWTNSKGTAVAPTNMALFQMGVAAPALTFTAAASNSYYACVPIQVNNAGTAIVVKTTFSGTSIAYNVSATIKRVI